MKRGTADSFTEDAMPHIDSHIVNETSSTHSHDYLQLIIPMDDTLEIRLADRTLQVHTDEVCFLSPGVQHHCIYSSRLILIDIPDSMFNKRDRQILAQPLICPLLPALKPFVDLIYNEIIAGPDKEAIRYLYYYLYHKIMHEQNGAKVLTRSQQYIHQHFAESISVADLAALENYNVTYFNEWFKSLTGHSPVAYLRRIRVEEACRRLLETDLDVGAIAEQVGYENHSSFTRAFKQIMGMSPQDYRTGTGQPLDTAPRQD